MKALVYVLIALMALILVSRVYYPEEKKERAKAYSVDSLGFIALKDSLGLNDRCIYVPYEDDGSPDHDTNVKACFYIAVPPKDTFHYAIQQNDSIFLWAIVSGEGVHLVRDL